MPDSEQPGQDIDPRYAAAFQPGGARPTEGAAGDAGADPRQRGETRRSAEARTRPERAGPARRARGTTTPDPAPLARDRPNGPLAGGAGDAAAALRAELEAADGEPQPPRPAGLVVVADQPVAAVAPWRNPWVVALVLLSVAAVVGGVIAFRAAVSVMTATFTGGALGEVVDYTLVQVLWTFGPLAAFAGAIGLLGAVAIGAGWFMRRPGRSS